MSCAKLIRMMTPTLAYRLSLAQLGVWLAIPLSIVVMMCRTGGPDSLGGFVFLAFIAAALGGVGVLAGLVGSTSLCGRAGRAPPPVASREARTSVNANIGLGALQIAAFAASFVLLTHLHH